MSTPAVSTTTPAATPPSAPRSVVNRLAVSRALPDGAPVTTLGTAGDLAALVAGGGVLVLTGAGVSTGSGVPDYRGPRGAFRSGHVPMQYAEFTGSPEARLRYWARGLVGWQRISAARPGACHTAVAALERAGLVRGVVTQNVDGLHQAAGSEAVVELHGALHRVVCLDCAAVLPRAQFDRRLDAANPGFGDRTAALVDSRRINPDGDVELPEEALAGFTVVDCPVCEGGRLKPDVVFFGESVPRERVRRVNDALAASRSLVVLGSSLAVMSGYRFVRAAVRAGQPVAVVTAGPSRADGDLVAGRDVRLDAQLEPVLEELVGRLCPEAASATVLG